MTPRPLAGHTFLATLGKRRLRPGGKTATEWLFSQGSFTENQKVLEIACNQGTSSIELAKRYAIHLVACDLDEKALSIARKNAQDYHVDTQIEFVQADARALPFEDNTFDILLNEAMLTMLSLNDKRKALQEYYRVLRPGGLLLTHDVVLRTEDPALQKQIRKDLSQAINVDVQPFDAPSWTSLFKDCGFKTTQNLGPMSLMSPQGMIKDEGLKQTFVILGNALHRKNRKQFMTMFRTFRRYTNQLGYIAIASLKPDSKDSGSTGTESLPE